MFWSKKQSRVEENAGFAEPGEEQEGEADSFTVEKWCELQETIMFALKPYRDAWDAVLAALKRANSPAAVEG